MPETIKAALFSVNFNETAEGISRVRFAAGTSYPLADDADGELRRCIARGIATEVDVELPEPPADEADESPQSDADAGAGDPAGDTTADGQAAPARRTRRS